MTAEISKKALYQKAYTHHGHLVCVVEGEYTDEKFKGGGVRGGVRT